MSSPAAIFLLWAGSVTALYLSPGAWAEPATTGGGVWTFPTTMELERALPRRGVALEELVARDRARHARGRSLLGSSSLAFDGVVSLPVDGTFNPYTAGLYFTRVKLGNPWKEFYVQIDTGSDIMWVTCSPCDGCPASSALNIQLELYEPDKSTTSSQVTCGDDRCTTALQSGYALCSTSDSSSAPCDYMFKYGDGSGCSGYYVADEIHINSILETGQILNSSAPIMFGCSNSQSGDLAKPDMAVDGIFGFGQHELSVISQLSSAGVVPKVFSHCFKGSNTGGGILVLGGIVEPGIIYTPMVQAANHYHVSLESIDVNGQTLFVDPSVGTIIDSGTTLTYLAEQTYDPLMLNQCFVTSSSIDDSFPTVTLNFMGGASMRLKPEDYLMHESGTIWCMGWKKSPKSGDTIIGDIILKDKIFIYDLDNQQIGWTNHDCKHCSCFQSVNITTVSGRSVYLNTRQLDVFRSSVSASCKKLSTVVLALVYIVTLVSLWR